jgi:hypothetical protein
MTRDIDMKTTVQSSCDLWSLSSCPWCRPCLDRPGHLWTSPPLRRVPPARQAARPQGDQGQQGGGTGQVRRAPEERVSDLNGTPGILRCVTLLMEVFF